MNELGLPLCFQTSKQRSWKTKGKSKAVLLEDQENENRFEDQVQESCIMSKESLSHATDISCHSSSLSLPHQIEVSCSGSDVSNESTRCNARSYKDGPANLVSEITDLEIEPEMSAMAASSNLSSGNAFSRSYILDDGLKPQQEEMGTSLTEDVNSEGPEFSVMRPEDLGYCNTLRQTNVVEDDHDDNAKCNGSEDENVKCYGSSGDWRAFWDSFYLRYYFYNAKTHESTWYPPSGMENFDFGDMSCISSESNVEVTGIDSDPATSRCEEQKADGSELVERIDSEEMRIDPMQVSSGNIADDLSTYSAVLADKVFVVNGSDIQNVDGNHQDEISSVTLSHPVEHNYLEDIEMKTNDLSTQDVASTVKPKKTRKNRRRKNTSGDNKGHGLLSAEESFVDITKYWHQRYLLFSRFDSGIKMDDEGWFSVTPEAIARHQASRSAGGIIIDCFTGVGGNAIQFAKTGKHVIAIDIDPMKIDYARHNASIYGVEDRIDFIMGDSLYVAPNLKADTVFLSPPWGGPDYINLQSYDIGMLQPYDGHFLFNNFKTMASMIIMFLPRNVDLVQLAELALSPNCEWSLDVEKNYLNGKLKAVTAYFYKTSAQSD